MTSKEFDEAVYAIVKRIPKGKVTTYGTIALLCGNPHWSRRVGRALHHNPYFGIVPCHRVVFADGRLAQAFGFGGAEIQKQLLQNDGVEVFDDFTVDLNQYLWDPNKE